MRNAGRFSSRYTACPLQSWGTPKQPLSHPSNSSLWLGIGLPSLSPIPKSFPLQNRLPIPVHLQLCNRQITRANPHGRTRPTDLFTRDTFNVYNPSFAVHSGDPAFAAFVVASCHDDFVVFAEGHWADLFPKGNARQSQSLQRTKKLRDGRSWSLFGTGGRGETGGVVPCAACGVLWRERHS